jgi:hypothetical protein
MSHGEERKMPKITIEMTDHWAKLIGMKREMPVRVWRGTSEQGTPVVAYVFGVVVQGGKDESKYAEFAAMHEYRPDETHEIGTITLSFATDSDGEKDVSTK